MTVSAVRAPIVPSFALAGPAAVKILSGPSKSGECPADAWHPGTTSRAAGHRFMESRVSA